MATPDLNHLAVFVAVAQAGSFTGAARALGVPKSTISRAIAGLEDAMGVRLVHRTTRHVALSTTGAALYDRAAAPLAQLRASFGELPDLEDEPSGDLRITAPVDVAAALLSDVVARFTARYPGIRIDLALTNRVIDLVTERFDVAFRIWTTARMRDSSLLAQKAMPLSIQLFASPSYLARRGTPRAPADLAGHEWVEVHGASTVRLENAGAVETLRLRGRITSDDMSFTREALRAGAGIGLLPAFLADTDVVSGALVRVLPRWTVPTGALWIVSPSVRQMPKKVVAFRRFALEALKAR
jgi:DNA-binding transcriptional LysR family regulator